MTKRDGALNWAISALVSILGSVLASIWFRAPAYPGPMTVVPSQAIRVTEVAIGEAALLDKTPLFLPTRWNTSQGEIKPPDASGALVSYPGKFLFADSELKLDNLPVAVVTPASPSEALAIPMPGPLFGGLGRSDVGVEPLSKRGAYLEVAVAGTGRRILGEALSTANPPGGGAWQALEFVAVIGAAGLVFAGFDQSFRSGGSGSLL